MAGARMKTEHSTPVTNKAGSRRDEAIASDLIGLRRLLLGHDTIRKRLLELGSLRPAAPYSIWDEPTERYWESVAQCERDLDRAWSQAELDIIAAYAPDLDNTAVCVGLGLGRQGRGRRTSAPVLELVARSIAFRAGGMRAKEADYLAAGLGWANGPNALRKYRKVLRDRRT